MNRTTEDTTSTESRITQTTAAERSTTGCGSAASVALRLGGNDGGSAPLSNTAPANCTDMPSTTRILRRSVDSLYLSYKGKLSPEVEAKLDALKLAAQSEDEKLQASAVYCIGNHAFEVSGRGKGHFPLVLNDNWFHLQLSRANATRLPMCYVQLGSELLTRAGVEASVTALSNLIGELGAITQPPTVSRIDLCVDFVTEVDFVKLPRGAWVSRAHQFTTYYDRKHITGFTFGQSGDFSARLYNKTLELKKSNKQYLVPLWQAAGWDGVADVWRLEFQIRRNILSEASLRTIAETMRLATALWDYATTEWLRLTEPSETDQTQTRWPTHPLWQVLQAIAWNTEETEPLQRVRKSRDPSDQRLFVHGLGAVTSFMAKTGEANFDEALSRFGKAARLYHRERSRHTGKTLDTYVREKVEVKARRFNTTKELGEGEA